LPLRDLCGAVVLATVSEHQAGPRNGQEKIMNEFLNGRAVARGVQQNHSRLVARAMVYAEARLFICGFGCSDTGNRKQISGCRYFGANGSFGRLVQGRWELRSNRPRGSLLPGSNDSPARPECRQEDFYVYATGSQPTGCRPHHHD
jgi:hypothetical protein